MNLSLDSLSLTKLAEQMSPIFAGAAQGFSIFSPFPDSGGMEFDLIAPESANLNTPNVTGSLEETFTFIKPENLVNSGKFFSLSFLRAGNLALYLATKKIVFVY